MKPSTHKEELQKRNHLGTVSRQTAVGLKPVLLERNLALDSDHYENMPIQIYWKFYHHKNENFQTKNSDIFHINAQGGSNEYPQSMFY